MADALEYACIALQKGLLPWNFGITDFRVNCAVSALTGTVPTKSKVRSFYCYKLSHANAAKVIT